MVRGHVAVDPEVKPMAWAALGLGLAVLIVLLLTAWVYHVFDQARPLGQRQTAVGKMGEWDAKLSRRFPEPRLEAEPAFQLKGLRAWEETQLNHYGWIDKEAGVVRIPIERAMDLLAERGLAAFDGASASAGKSSLELMHERAEGFSSGAKLNEREKAGQGRSLNSIKAGGLER